MDTIRHLFRIGHGPSSSHTMAPRRAAERFYAENPTASHFMVELYGSLALTGKGHFTDKAILEVLPQGRAEIVWVPEKTLPFHPNGMRFTATFDQSDEIHSWTVYSVGGGALSEGPNDDERLPIYPHKTLAEIMEYCFRTGKQFWEYVEEYEGAGIWDYLKEVRRVMYAAIERGLNTEGVIPGGLGVSRKASTYLKRGRLMNPTMASVGRMISYTLAVSEENATGGEVVTAPTCGSCGVVPGLLRYLEENLHHSEDTILKALATAGLIGNIVKHNGSISGAMVGCQGEVGVAASMAAAACAQLYSCSIRQIEYAAEMALEHHLGLTCDPILGLVQVPCIERNAFAVGTAIFCGEYVFFSDGTHFVSFDEVVETMMRTGMDMPSLYRETSEGGLAKFAKSGHGQIVGNIIPVIRRKR
ncbi:serine dehydratase [Anaerolineaceae bacterium oral taxon 439]|nr:serine dehydratase [Anaerolineaceae bacterium oral taxon 439]